MKAVILVFLFVVRAQASPECFSVFALGGPSVQPALLGKITSFLETPMGRAYVDALFEDSVSRQNFQGFINSLAIKNVDVNDSRSRPIVLKELLRAVAQGTAEAAAQTYAGMQQSKTISLQTIYNEHAQRLAPLIEAQVRAKHQKNDPAAVDTLSEEVKATVNQAVAEAMQFVGNNYDRLAVTPQNNTLFVGKDVRFASFNQINANALEGFAARFAGAKAAYAEFNEAQLKGTVNDDVSAPNSSWRGANVFGASFRGADLSNANLREMVVAEADFSGAQLQGADLTGWKMHRIGFNETIAVKLKNAVFDANTILPLEFGRTREERIRTAENLGMIYVD